MLPRRIAGADGVTLIERVDHSRGHVGIYAAFDDAWQQRADRIQGPYSSRVHHTPGTRLHAADHGAPGATHGVGLGQEPPPATALALGLVAELDDHRIFVGAADHRCVDDPEVGDT